MEDGLVLSLRVRTLRVRVGLQKFSQVWKAAVHPSLAPQRAQLTLLKYNELLAAEMAAGLVPNPQYTMH